MLSLLCLFSLLAQLTHAGKKTQEFTNTQTTCRDSTSSTTHNHNATLSCSTTTLFQHSTTASSKNNGILPPNIVIVVLDDVGWAGLKGYNGGVSGNQYPTTPHMDRSIRKGIKLTNMYVQAMCSPTRGAMMTGRFPHRFGGQHFVQQPFMPTWMPKDETTLANKMKALGYKTSIVGKWHLGYGKIENTPCARGFDTFFGSYSVGGHHYDHTVGPDTHAMGTLFTLNEGHQQTLDLHRSTSTDGGKTRATHTFAIDQKGIYSSQMIGNDVAKQIHRHASTTPEIPLFMYVAFTTIHTPLMVDETYIQRNQHMQGTDEIRLNAGMMTAMDEGYGTIVTALEETGLWENTIVLTFSDNGAMISQGASNYPLRGQKMGPFEGGIRSVAFVTGGHRDVVQSAGSTSHAMFHVVDVHTLALQWASPFDNSIARYSNPPYKAKPLDSVNGLHLWETMQGKRVKSPRTGFVSLLDDVGAYLQVLEMSQYTMLGKCVAARMGKWKLIEGKVGRDDWYPTDVSKCFPKLAHEGTLFTPPLDHSDCIRGDFQYEKIGKFGRHGTPGTEGIRQDGGLFVPKALWLFDIEKDPSERHDLSLQHPEIVEQLRAEIQLHRINSVPPFPDRWDSLVGMMNGNFHVENIGGGYEAGLTSWMEEKHLKSISFYRRAKSWLRQTALGLGTKLMNYGQVHREDTASTNLEFETITEQVKRTFGKFNNEPFTKMELLKIEKELLEMEREEGEGGEDGKDRNFQNERKEPHYSTHSKM